MLNEAIKKKFSISKENLRNINLFIEIYVLINIQQYLIKISKKMKLNLKFVNKISKDANDNEVIFFNQKNIKSKYLKSLNKSIFSTKVFLQNSFLKKDYNDKSYISTFSLKIKSFNIRQKFLFDLLHGESADL